MKKRYVTVLILALLMIPTLLSANSETAATVNLIREEVITYDDLRSKVEEEQKQLQSAGEQTASVDPQRILDVMINDILVLQGAERDGYLVSDAQIEQVIAQQKASLSQQTGQNITDAQYEMSIMNVYGVTLSEFKAMLRDSSTVDQYVRNTQQSVINVYGEPTEDEINAFFRTNRSQFMNPELVRLSHIFMPFDESDKASVKKEMDKVSRYLKYNTYTFEELVPTYSQDADSIDRGGDIGWLAFDDTQMRQALGPEFFDAVFELKLGKPSGVLESNSGFHIVKVITHTEPKLLSLTDRINPESSTTVKEYIKKTLTDRLRQQAYLKGIDSLVAQLRSQASIDISYTGESIL